MLAQLLRRLILVQFILGGALGYWLARTYALPGWSTLLCALLMPMIVLTLLTVASCTISRTRAEPASMWWRSLYGEWLAGIRIFLVRQPWTWNKPDLLPLDPGSAIQPQVPVVLVHGYLCNHRIWDDVVTALRARGHTVFAVNLEPVFTSIDRYVPIVEAAVQALMQHTGQPKVALVGHSMGGLAIRAWMRSEGTQNVARVLTLGTPHTGTKLARSAHTPNSKQMQWKSQWLAELAASEGSDIYALMRIAITPQDNIVCPQRAQVLPTIQPVVFEGIGHLQMCTHPPVVQWLVQELGLLSPSKP